MLSTEAITEDQLAQDDIVINGQIKTKGSFTVETINTIEEDKLGIQKQIFTIRGVLRTKYYQKELNTLESIRYYVNGIWVTNESFSTEDDTVTYTFKADYFQPKFQDINYERLNND